jgi:hypothetical protein
MMKKSLWITLGIVFLLLGVFVWYKYFFVFGEGVKSGYLNYAIKKGYVFKTYEGKLIQEGFGRGKTGSITSYEFEFSVSDSEVFKQLEMNSGKTFDLHYKEYKGALPWRGNTKYVVDKIVNMK